MERVFVFFLQWLKPSYRHEPFKKTLYCLDRSITSVQCTKHQATYETSQLTSRNLSKSVVVGGLHFTQFVQLWEKWGGGAILKQCQERGREDIYRRHVGLVWVCSSDF